MNQAAVAQFLTFRVGQEEYGLPLLRVREIVPFTQVTRVPDTPAVLRGVMNLRGQVLPIVDLSMKFDQVPATPGKRTCVVITEVLGEGEPLTLGVLVDSVNQVLEASPDDVEPPPNFGLKLKLEYLKGLVRSGEGFIVLLESDRVLSTSELWAAARATEAREGNAAPEEPGASPSGDVTADEPGTEG